MVSLLSVLSLHPQTQRAPLHPSLQVEGFPPPPSRCVGPWTAEEQAEGLAALQRDGSRTRDPALGGARFHPAGATECQEVPFKRCAILR